MWSTPSLPSLPFHSDLEWLHLIEAKTGLAEITCRIIVFFFFSYSSMLSTIPFYSNTKDSHYTAA